MRSTELCSQCFEAVVPSCAQSIKVIANLDATTIYNVNIKTVLDKIYVAEITTDIDGSFTFDTNILPKGFNISQSGVFQMWVKKDIEQCGSDTMQFCIDSVLKPFECVLFNFIDTNLPINQIGCVC
jgi:hypothetical protein